MTERVQFIGGPLHGKFEIVGADEWCRLAIIPSPPCVAYNAEPFDPVSVFSEARYFRQRFVITGEGVREFFVLDSMGECEALARVSEICSIGRRDDRIPGFRPIGQQKQKTNAQRWLSRIELEAEHVCKKCGERRGRYLVNSLCFRCSGDKATRRD